jgi:hypothetical protein
MQNRPPLFVVPGSIRFGVPSPIIRAGDALPTILVRLETAAERAERVAAKQVPEPPKPIA